MDELLRLVAVRPAKPADPKKTTPSRAADDVVAVIQNARSPIERVRALEGQAVSVDLKDYHYGQAMAELGAWARGGDMSRDAVIAKAKALLGADPTGLGRQQLFTDEIATLDTTLAVLKYRSQSIGPAMLALQIARVGYDLMTQLGDLAVAKLQIRHVTLPLKPAPPPPPKEVPAPAPAPAHDRTGDITKIQQARLALRDAIRTGNFVPPEKPASRAAPARDEFGGAAQAGLTNAVLQERSWRVRAAAVKGVPALAAETIRANAGELASTPVTALSKRLSDLQATLRKQQA